MKRVWFGTALTLVLLLSFACGKKGPLVLPPEKAPQKIEAFILAQRGDKAILEWTNPLSYIDGSPLTEISAVEIWLLVEEKPASGTFQKLAPGTFNKQAKIAATLKKEELASIRKKTDASTQAFIYRHTLSSGQMAGQRLTFGLKVKDKDEKESDFSKLQSIETLVLPGSPQNVKATVLDDKVEIRWDPPAGEAAEAAPKPESAASSVTMGYNVYRSKGQEPPALLNSTLVTETKYDDKNFEFGQDYGYFVRTSASASPPYQESDDSQNVEVKPKDVFPPAAPSGLLTVAGDGFIALSWEANSEKDLAGYSVWRRAEGEADYRLLTPQPVSENNYTDRAVEKEKTYSYLISARDLSGNESTRSEAVSVIVKEKES